MRPSLQCTEHRVEGKEQNGMLRLIHKLNEGFQVLLLRFHAQEIFVDFAQLTAGSAHWDGAFLDGPPIRDSTVTASF